MPNKRAKVQPKKKRRSGDPITVGGGGSRRKKGRLTTNPVYITFSANYEDQEPTHPKKKKLFKHKTANMKSLVVSINGVPTNLNSLIPDPAVGKCTVTINCKGSDEDLEISSNKISIKLHTGTYPPESSGPKHEENPPDSANFIKRVKVKVVPDTGAAYVGYDSGPLDASKKVEVVADT